MPVPADLSHEEVRVLGCLIEKEVTTPDNYPLTLNSLRNACNQSTSRDPVVSYSEIDVEQALMSLRERGFARTVHNTSNRTLKYRHTAAEVLNVDRGEAALISVLLLRGPQTVGELKSRSERQYRFESTDLVAATLTQLAAREAPLVRRLDRRPGQKDARWVDLLSPREVSPSDAADRRPTPDATSSDDPYGEATAEFYDLLATAHWETFGFELLDLLAGVDASTGPIIDLGSGTGYGLPYIIAAVPDARIHAIEPSRAMRTALHTRLGLADGLRRVVTVDPRALSDADLPDGACALVGSAVLGHLSDAERLRLWRFVAERMAVGAPAVIEVLPPERPIVVPPTKYRELLVGEYMYEGWQEGAPADENHMAWTMTYRVLHQGAQIAEYRVRSRWRCFSAADVTSEVASHGLSVDGHAECVVVRRSG